MSLRRALALALIVLCSSVASAGLRPPLDRVLEGSAPDALVPVSVVLKEQVPIERMNDARKGLERREGRRQVLALLKETARATQAPLLERLRVLEAEGRVARIRPLWIGNVVGVDATPDVIRAIAARPEVAWVNHNPKSDVSLDRFSPAPPAEPRTGTDGFEEIECGVGLMRAPDVWSEFGNTGEGAVVAVIDSGVCWTHSDIVNQIWVNPGEDLDHDGVVMDPDDMNGVDNDGNGFVDDLIGWDFDQLDNQPSDDNSHGSHCAGTVAGDGTAGTQTGMAPDAKIMVVRVGLSFSDEVDVWNAMQYAADNGADTISMSLGWPHNQNPDRATWRQNCEATIEAGTAMVIAAGNEGWGAEPDNIRTPGDVPRVITVAATDCSDNITGFSSRGPVSWSSVSPFNDWPYPPGLVKPDVAAPGDNTKSHNVCSGYSFKSGTSMATPHVAGAVALMVSASPGLGHDDIKQILEETAIDRGAAGKDNEYGAGRVDAYAAVQNVANPDGRIRIKEASASCQGTLSLTLADSDLKGLGTHAVEVFSSTEASPENFVLVETGPTSGVFKGTAVTDGGAVAADGKVQVRHGDVVTARYVDASDGKGGTNVVKTATAAADCRGPSISQVGETNVSDVAATIVWQTDEASGSVVTWGETKPPGSSSSAGGLTTSHSVTLTGLQSCTVYWYRVSSTDAPGNTAVDDNGGLYHSFETMGDFGDGLQPCHAGKLTVARSVYSCADAVPVKVIDIDLNLSAVAVDTVAVQVSSTTQPTPETLVLTETGPNTAQFTGSIPTASGAPVAGDGILQVSGGDVISATYHDANDGTGSPAVSFASADVDCAGPQLSQVRVTDVTDDSAIVRWTTQEPSTSKVEWGPTAALGNVVQDGTLKTSHALTVATLTECGRFHFRVTSVDTHGNVRVLDAAGAPFQFNAGIIPGLYRENFDGSHGWTLEGEWQVTGPQARGTSPGDPGSAFTGSNVLGLDLTGLGQKPGDYELNSDTRAISPVLNASSLTGGKVKFRRWLNVGGGGIAYVEVKQGSNWVAAWSNQATAGVTESAWSLQTVDISPWADGNATLQIAFRIRAGFNSSSNRAGWNVDRFVVKGSDTPEFVACGGCGGAPTFAGLESVRDLDGCGDTGVELKWSVAPSWGTGGGGTYSVFRSTDPAFTPSASNRIAAGIAATVWTDTGAPNDVTHYYVVRAENDETCGGGPANGGVVDANVVRVSGRDATSQPDPGDVAGSLRLDPVNASQLRLSWAAQPGAGKYAIYRADAPAGPFVKRAETTSTSWDDRDELGNLNPRYYRVESVTVCE